MFPSREVALGVFLAFSLPGLPAGAMEDVPEEVSPPARPPVEEPAAAPPAVAVSPAEPEPEASTPGWFRVDTDGYGTQLWFGATHPLGDGIGLASDIYVVGTVGQFDLGLTFTPGSVSLTPMVGVALDFASHLFTLLVPQLYTTWDGSRLYFESWIHVYMASVFEEGAKDVFHTRNFLLYKLNDGVALGPHVELFAAISEQDGPGGHERGIESLPLGAALRLEYGRNNTLLLFLGYDKEAGDDTDKVAGRFTFVRNW